MSATVFSSVEIRIGGSRADMGKVGDLVLVRRLDTKHSLAVCGFVESELRFTMKGELTVSPGDVIELYMDGMRFADHYVDDIRRNGDTVRIRAHDLMRGLSARWPTEISAPVRSQQFIGGLAQIYGFTGAAGVPLMDLYPSDVNKRTGRQILMAVSEYGCGVWYCSNGNALCFTAFGQSSGEHSMTDGTLYAHSVKGPITAVTAENTASREVYTAGSASPQQTLRLSGPAFTQARTTELASALVGVTVRSFYAEGMTVYVPTEGLSAFVQDGVRYIAYRTELRFGSRVWAKAYTEDICDDGTDLVPASGLVQGMTEGRLYGTVSADGDGSGIVEEPGEDVRGASRHGFSAVVDDVTMFDGAVLDGTMPDRIEKVSDTVRRIVYGGSSYLLSYQESGGTKTDITLVKEV